MYIFNPEHDLCIANGDIHFVPPESALAFGRDCASIVGLMEGLDKEADSGFEADSCFGAGSGLVCAATPEAGETVEIAVKIGKIVPWGWNSVLCGRLVKQGIPESMLPSQEQLQNIITLSHRKIGHEALEYVYTCTNGAGTEQADGVEIEYGRQDLPLQPASLINPDYRIAAETLDCVEQFLAENQNIVLKAPLSGSGKGIRFVSKELSHSDAGWCRNLIAKHGYVVAERRMQPVLEFAMLFKIGSGGCVDFRGYSLFWTANGAYRGNILASDDFIKKEIEKYVPTELLNGVQSNLVKFMKSRLSGKYEGFVGVDQFVCKDFIKNPDGGCTHNRPQYFFNPVVEINLRMTMGLVARNIYDRFKGQFGLQEGSHVFEICRNSPEKGRYSYKIDKTFLHLQQI